MVQAQKDYHPRQDLLCGLQLQQAINATCRVENDFEGSHKMNKIETRQVSISKHPQQEFLSTRCGLQQVYEMWEKQWQNCLATERNLNMESFFYLLKTTKSS